MRLPAAGRYALALAIVAVVVGLVLVLRAGDNVTSEPPVWYAVVVRVGAVVLLAYGALSLVRRLMRRR